jgi:hypothetical protein
VAVHLRIQPADLGALDALAVDALFLPFHAQVGQPQGPAGFVDWRLCGRIGRLLASGTFRGGRDEAVMMSPLSRIGVKRIVLLGLGDPGDAKAAVERLIRVAEDAHIEDLAIAPPEPFSTAEDAAGVFRGWLSGGAIGRSKLKTVVLLDLDGALERTRPELAKAIDQSGAWLE